MSRYCDEHLIAKLQIPSAMTCGTKTVSTAATLDADGYTAAMQQIDITGLSDIKVIFTGGEFAYIPY